MRSIGAEIRLQPDAFPSVNHIHIILVPIKYLYSSFFSEITKHEVSD